MYRKVADVFVGAAGKTLSAVDVNPRVSHQHEINGNRHLIRILGQPIERVAFSAVLVYLDDELSPLVDEVDGAH